MDEATVHSECLCDGLCAIVSTLVIGEMERLESAVLALEVLRDGFAAAERDLVGVEVKDAECVVLEQVFHHDVDTIIAEQVLLDAELLQTNVVLEHLAEMDSDTLADGTIHRVVNVKLVQSEV